MSVYIDGANLYQGSKDRGGIDRKRFSIRLSDKYNIQQKYIFLGYIKGKETYYKKLSEAGFILIFKETLFVEGKVKGNCDAELVLQAVADVYECGVKNAVLVTGDGDFACLVDFYLSKSCKITLLAPNRKYCSCLLKKKNIPLVMLEDIHHKIQKKSPQ